MRFAALSTDRRPEVTAEASALASGLNPQASTTLAHAIDQNLRGQVRAAATITALLDRLPAAATKGLNQALQAIPTDHHNAAQNVGSFTDKMPQAVHDFVTQVVTQAQTDAQDLRDTGPAPRAPTSPNPTAPTTPHHPDAADHESPVKLAHAAALRAQLTTERGPTSVPPRPLPPRSASLRSRVAEVLAAADRPLRAREIRAVVELLLGESVSSSSVKGTLGANARGASARFERVCRGRYRLA